MPSAPEEPLVDTLLAALTRPESVTPAAVALLESTLERAARGQSPPELALATLAALLYGRPDVVSDGVLDSVVALLRVDSTESLVEPVRRLWEFLAATSAAPRAWALLCEALQDPRLGPETRARLVPLVGTFAQWREDLVDLDVLLTLAACPELATHRAALLDHGVERAVFSGPEHFTLPRLRRLGELFGNLTRYRYVLYALAGRPGLPPAAQAHVEAELGGRFTFQQRAATILTGRPIRVLVMMNVGMGQGDEMVRLVPLLQALLDANPALTITLVTRRRYLYDHPRVTVVPIGDDVLVQAALREPFDGLLEFFQPEWAHFVHRLELHPAIEELRAARPPAFLIQGDMGRACLGHPGKRSQFLYQRVELADEDVADVCGLDRREHPSIYDPGHRLLAELGLPLRAGEERPQTPALLTGAPSADAERVWMELLPSGDGPVALVSPFGGSGAIKGFLQQEALLAAELAGLVAEGYRVVVLPQDAAWARPPAVDAVLGHLTGSERARVRVAPDPAGVDVAAGLALTERADLPPADRVVRLFKYFASYADLVVTVEGWLAHMAYLLGRPFRVFLAAGSYTLDWLPHGRSRGQRLVPSLSAGAVRAHMRSGLLGPDDAPPLPHALRKHLLEVALAGLGSSGTSQAVAPLRRAATSPDAPVRAWAVAALGRLDPAAHKPALLAALADPSPIVVREAADALLRGDVDCRWELGARSRDLIEAYADGARENWEAVARVGPPALPALFHLARSNLHDVQWGAKGLLRRVLAPWVPVSQEGGGPAVRRAGTD